jgi:hypothetical protein
MLELAATVDCEKKVHTRYPDSTWIGKLLIDPRNSHRDIRSTLGYAELHRKPGPCGPGGRRAALIPAQGTSQLAPWTVTSKKWSSGLRK